MRYWVPNGITLCTVCHAMVTGREKEMAPLLMRMVGK